MYIKYNSDHKIIKIIDDKEIYHYDDNSMLNLIRFDVTKWQLLKLVIKYIFKGI